MKRIALVGLGLFLLALGLNSLLWLAGYVGVWTCWVGSLVDFCTQVKKTDIDKGLVAIDLLCFFVCAPFCVAVGWWSGFILMAGSCSAFAAACKE